MRESVKSLLNGCLAHVGMRVVSSRWGPRGPFNTLRRVRDLGIVPAQVVDAGACIGQWTLECLRVFPAARYFLVDPLPQIAPALAALSARNPSVTFWSGGLGAAEGRLPLYVHLDQSSFLTSNDYSARSAAPPVEVEVRTLDSFLRQGALLPPQFIKADVQGFEIEILKGAQKCLESTELLLLEVSYRRIYDNCPLAHEVLSYVGAKGFRIYDICTYAQRPHDGELAQSDILFARAGSHLFQHEGWK